MPQSLSAVYLHLVLSKRLILLTAGIALVCGVFCGRPAYRHYKETRGLRQAKAFLAAGDLANVSLSARQILELNPKNVEACQIIAELAELSHSPAVIDWRQRIAELAPTVANRLKLASCALRFQRPPYSLASQILQELDPLARAFPAFHVISAELALRSNRPDQAAAHFEEAARLEPDNQLHQLNLSVLKLQSTNTTAASAARVNLEHLSRSNNVAPLALRWLVADSLRRNDLPDAELFSGRLLVDPRAQWNDCLTQLELLQRARLFTFSNYLGAVQAAAATNVADVYSLAEWMGNHGLAKDAMKWLRGFDPKMRDAQPVPLAMANLYLAQADWTGLDTFLDGQKWADVEFLRLALLARAAWGREQNVAGEARWRGAVRATGDRLGPLTLLLGLATDWGRDSEDLLWQIGRRFPREQWALRELEGRYLAAGNTRGLNMVYATAGGSKSHPQDSTNQNNFATTSLLLKANLAQAHQAARELHYQRPGDAIIASTYAYSLHLQGRTGDALGVLGQIKPEALETPAVALYYGVLLAAAGENSRAAHYLALAETARLLPEERALLAAARKPQKEPGLTQGRKDTKAQSY